MQRQKNVPNDKTIINISSISASVLSNTNTTNSAITVNARVNASMRKT